MGDRILAEPQFTRGVRIAVECKDAPGRECTCGKPIVDVLTMPVAIEFDRDAALRRLAKDQVPVG
jgi:hypothetical protein